MQQILDVSTKLFQEKGFEKTSLQDIIHELNMSKGAIYHHFKSKDEILRGVMDRQFRYATEKLEELIEHTEAAHAKEKLQLILEQLVADPQSHSIDGILVDQMKNPQFVIEGMKTGVNQDALRIKQLIIEGIEDGSMETAFPGEVAEVFLLLVNIWLNPTLFVRNHEETVQRLCFLKQMMKGLGVDIVSDLFIQKVTAHYAEIGGYDLPER
ncbi:TetR/AcrR family transcriptional regulator [Bacillus altitudinis]|jgi:TetR/AcrR family transcriptional repressor of nem operon|uniref:TetR family transcriptional regulator n=3 Tax=Bacillus TaxID=1386 RepID=A0A1K1WFK2_BACAB|nr:MULTISPECIES: TetR/AcrR family transcriptional regulator [Bacillus]KML00627.1 TetR family transcriptional regulator [Bacillus stratosphericus]MBX7003218.1 TetR/AcrR family transcriptional regulator [Bacillus aerophilus]EIL85490.1 tetR-family transcriptional regulator [Bacillus sp. M 2-6]KAJ0072268.1 TetR/AcrR family transcriptional regulator [Bacillus altitudinis]KLV22804.1 TetR family transcriptional regulator [Bacillus altitudinis]